MTIGLNETLNKLSGVGTDKLAKKDEFTTQDFSSISKQFSNIFNNQFKTQFHNQFDYKQMFSNGSSTSNFMSNTASKMSDEKYSSQSYNLKSNSNELAKRAESSKESFERNTSKTEVKTQEQSQNNNAKDVKEKEQVQNNNARNAQENEQVQKDNAKNAQEKEQIQKDNAKNEQKMEQVQKDENNSKVEGEKQAKHSEKKQSKDLETVVVENVQKAEVQDQVIASLLSTQQVVDENGGEVTEEETESENVPKDIKAEKALSADDTAKTSDKLLVSVKDTELKNLADLTSNETDLTPKVEVDLKDVKIEKLDVKSKHQAVKQDKENLKPEVETHQKSEAVAIDNSQNKVSLERLAANVVAENPEATTALDKLLNKDIIKKADTSAKHIAKAHDNSDKKVEVDFKNAFMNNQSFNQNFGQSNQDSQSQAKANLLASNMTLGASLSKQNIQGNMQMNNLAQPSPANNMAEKNVFDQVMKNIQGKVSAEKSEVTMILKPEHLGKVTLNIMNEKGTISAEFKAETKQAVDSLNKNIEELKETLKQQGVICSNLVVKLEEPKHSDNNPQFAQEQNLKDFSQDNAQNSGKESWKNESNNQTVTNENNQDIQVEQEQPKQVAEDQGLVDYRV